MGCVFKKVCQSLPFTIKKIINPSLSPQAMIIPLDAVQQDLDRIMAVSQTWGEGTSQDRAAQQLLGYFRALEKLLGKPQLIDDLYLQNHAQMHEKPALFADIARDYVQGNTDDAATRQRLQEAQEAYSAAFAQLGITPTVSFEARYRIA